MNSLSRHLFGRVFSIVDTRTQIILYSGSTVLFLEPSDSRSKILQSFRFRFNREGRCNLVVVVRARAWRDFLVVIFTVPD